jgi:peptidoglycan/xylan/chitin deacetylase (PgdA/CDA1 family)
VNPRAPHAEPPRRPPRPDELLILLYHGVTDRAGAGIENFSGKHMAVGEFRRQMEIVRRQATPIALEDLIAHRGDGRPLPPHPVVVTFDDGFRNNATVAAPLLEALAIPATFYIAAGVVSSRIMFWVDEIEDCINLAPEVEIAIELERPSVFELGDPASRIRAVTRIKRYCKGVGADAKDRVVRELVRATGVVPSVEHAANYEKISWAELRMLDRHPLFTIGGHTLFHDILSALPLERMRRDVALSTGLLSYALEHPIRHYSYPEGQAAHYDEDVIGCLVEHGIVCSPSAIPGYDNPRADLFHLRRNMPGFMDSPFPFDLEDPDLDPARRPLAEQDGASDLADS